MDRIKKTFKKLKDNNELGLFPFIVAGYPNIKATEQAIYTLTEQGADLIELGVPFSDPVADGPVIQEASFKALQRGISLNDIFSLVKRVRKKINTPIVLMTYYNPLLHYGLKEVVKKAFDVGVDGFIVPDLPPEYANELNGFIKEKGLSLIFLTTINSSKERIKKISRMSKGFIYLVSRLGVTGVSSLNIDPVTKKIKEIKKYSKTPIALGFGVSNANQVKAIGKVADAVIVGSAIVKIMKKKNFQKELASSVKNLKRACKQ